MTYQRVIATRYGGPEVLQIVSEALRPPAAKEVRIKVLAASVSRPDISSRSGQALYRGTPLAQKVPFTPGYAVIGDVEAVGDEVTQVRPGERVGVLTVVGGYSEILYWRSDRLIPAPAHLDPALAVPLILNYLVAYQVLHRAAQVRQGETLLIVGASGGIGTALLQLGQLAGLKMIGLASKSKHNLLAEYGAAGIDYRTEDLVTQVRRIAPDGLDVAADGMTRLAMIRSMLGLLRNGGRLVSFGEPESLPQLFRILATLAKTNISPNRKRFKMYGTSTYFLASQQPYLEDWAALFKLLEAGKIQPIIAARYPILEAAQANALLESGQVIGNIVLLAPELL
jgi:NADPH:quinone reductase-like Zn-dependent oxidoreductase